MADITGSEFTGVRDSIVSGSANENRHVRYVDERIFLYAPQYAPLLLLKGGIMAGPNGERIKVKGIIDSGFVPAKKVEWFEKDLLDQDLYTNAAFLVGDLSITVDDGAAAISRVPRVGDMVEVVTNGATAVGEQIFITAVAYGVGQTTLTILRGRGGTSAAALEDNAVLRVVSNAQKENSSSITSRGRIADAYYNVMQIDRDDWEISRSDDRIRLYGGRDKAETMAEAAVNHVRIMERSLVFGGRDDAGTLIDADGNQVYAQGGMRYFIPNNYGASASTGLFAGSTHGGTIDPITEFLEVFCKEGFRYGNIRRKKIFIGGSTWATIFNRLLTGTSPATGAIRARNKETAYGVAVTEIVSAFGALDFLPSGAIDEFLNTDGYLFDPENVKFCYLDNTFMVDNAQAPDVDGYKGYFLTEYCLKINGLKSHCRISGVTGPA